MKSIVILVKHYNRALQLDRTLSSIFRTTHNNYQVIVQDSDSTVSLSALAAKYPKAIFINRSKPDPSNWYSHIVSCNEVILWSLKTYKPDVLLMQDAECYHVGDVVSYAEGIDDSSYYSFGTFSADKELTFRSDFESIIEGVATDCTREAWGNGVSAWYNHPVYRGVGYAFCCAIKSSNLVKLNGFDERYMYGVAYGDDDFVHRIHTLGLKVTIPTYPFVVHQWHYDSSYTIDENLLRRNRDLYQEIATTEVNYRAKHILSEDFDIVEE